MGSRSRFDESVSAVTESGFPVSRYPTSDIIIPWEHVDETTKRYATSLVGSMLQSQKKVALIGMLGSGRNHLLNVIASSYDHWSELAESAPVFYNYTTPAGMAIRDNALDSIFKMIRARISEDGPGARMVVSRHETALLAEANGIPVVLLTTCEEFHAKEPNIDAWEIFETCGMEYPVEDIVHVLQASTHRPDGVNFTKKFSVNTHSDFVTSMIDHFEQLSPTDNGEREIIATPPGFWVQAYERAHAFAALADPPLSSPAEAIPHLEEKLRVDMDLEVISGPEAPNASIQSGVMTLAQALGIGRNTQVEPAHHSSFGDIADVAMRHPNTINASLKSTVLGQDEAIDQITDSLISAAAGLNSESKPIQSLMLLGPTGVGKTETALQLAKVAFEEEMNVVRLDMSEYADSHARSKLLGSPPGYVGYDEGGVLTNAVREAPHSLILLDEVEKAHPEVWDQFLQVLDAGRMTDGQGEEVDFTHTIVILTSNLGADKLSRRSLGFGTADRESDRATSEAIVNSAIRETMKPEFINRIGAQVLFDKLSDDSINAIVKREVSLLRDKLKSRGITLAMPRADIVNELALRVDRNYGARDVQRVVDTNVSRPAALAILDAAGEITNLKFSMKSKEIIIAPSAKPNRKVKDD